MGSCLSLSAGKARETARPPGIECQGALRRVLWEALDRPSACSHNLTRLGWRASRESRADLANMGELHSRPAH